MKPRFPSFICAQNLAYSGTASSGESSDPENMLTDQTDISARFVANGAPPAEARVDIVFSEPVLIDTFALCGHTFPKGHTWGARLSSTPSGPLDVYVGPDIPIGDYYADPGTRNPGKLGDEYHIITEVVDGAVVPKPLEAIRARIKIANPSGPIDGNIGLLWLCAATALGDSALSAVKPAAGVDLQGDRPVHTWNGGVASSDFTSSRVISCAFEYMGAQDANELHQALELCGTSHPVLFIPKPWLSQQKDADDAGGVVRFVKPFRVKPYGALKDVAADRYSTDEIQLTAWR